MAKRIRKSACKSLKVVNFTHIQVDRMTLRSTCACVSRRALGGITLAYEFELDQSQRKWHRKSTQVGGQTKGKLNASRKLASTCKSVWPPIASPFDGVSCARAFPIQ